MSIVAREDKQATIKIHSLKCLLLCSIEWCDELKTVVTYLKVQSQ